MTPKEKAIELVDMFMEHTVEWDKVTEVAFDSEYHAKQCALIAVDELIKTICYCYPINEYEISFVEYWQEVKQEIEKL
jgi:hypothetical protein